MIAAVAVHFPFQAELLYHMLHIYLAPWLSLSQAESKVVVEQVEVPVDRIVVREVEVPVEIKVPYPIEKIVEQTVIKEVEVIKEVPVVVEKTVEKVVTKEVPIERGSFFNTFRNCMCITSCMFALHLI